MANISRAWCFTINNPEESPEQLLQKWFNAGLIVYGVAQLERGEGASDLDLGTLHIQGYIITKLNPTNKNGYSLKHMKDVYDGTAHWEKRMGTHQQAVEYCGKEDTAEDNTWVEVGDWDPNNEMAKGGRKGGAANRSKIMQIKEKIDLGLSDRQLYKDHFSEMLRYGKAFDRYRVAQREQRRTHTRAVCLYGPSGTGKSFKARELAMFFAAGIEDNIYYWVPSKWWDGYTGQPVVVADEFYGQVPISEILRLLGEMPTNVETKGSMTPFMSEVVIFTSNEHPKDWYGKNPESKIPMDTINALLRRFEGVHGTVKLMSTPYVNNNNPRPMGDILTDAFTAIDRHQSAQEFVTLRNFITERCEEALSDSRDTVSPTPEDIEDDTPPSAWASPPVGMPKEGLKPCKRKLAYAAPITEMERFKKIGAGRPVQTQLVVEDDGMSHEEWEMHGHKEGEWNEGEDN